MTTRKNLTIYQLRSNLEGFDSAIHKDALETATPFEMVADADDFEARLYVEERPSVLPTWAPFLEEGFGEDIGLSASALNRAVVVVRLDYYNATRYFAITFGAGRYLVDRSVIERGFGLRSALNAIYEADDPNDLDAPARVRRVDAKTVAQNTLHTNRQTNRYATFEVFGVDVQRDLLNAVVGEPSDKDRWGSRIAGADPITVTVAAAFTDLGELCRNLWRLGRSDDYRVRFDWIDNIQSVVDETVLGQLNDQLVARLRSLTEDGLHLAPPEIVEWDDIAAFIYSIDSNSSFADMQLGDYLDVLAAGGLESDMTIDLLKKHRISATGSDGEQLHEWSVLDCLSGEIAHAGAIYLLEGGNYFVVAAGYLVQLDAYVGGLMECTLALPDSPSTQAGEQSEGDYNEAAANSSDQYLLLDKETVKVSTHTSPIEICDVLTTDGRFVHVKRKLSSSSLSHLFSQGYVSADLFLMSEEYRQVVTDKVTAAELKRSNVTGDPGFVGRFTGAFDFDTPQPSGIEVVYAVIAKWNGRSLVEALPFFSKVNLRRHAEDLRRMGYQVTYKRIDVT